MHVSRDMEVTNRWNNATGSLIHIDTVFQTYIYYYYMVQDIIWKADCQKISYFLTEPEGLLPYSHEPAIGHYPEPAESISPHRFLSP
jgi:hypothetical protein